jgi:hypothetical protein
MSADDGNLHIRTKLDGIAIGRLAICPLTVYVACSVPSISYSTLVAYGCASDASHMQFFCPVLNSLISYAVPS